METNNTDKAEVMLSFEGKYKKGGIIMTYLQTISECFIIWNLGRFTLMRFRYNIEGFNLVILVIGALRGYHYISNSVSCLYHGKQLNKSSYTKHV